MNKDNKYYICWEEVFERLEPFDKILNKVYGVPNGGMIACAFLKKAQIVTNPEDANIILDDIIDSGTTRKKYIAKYPNTTFGALVDKTKGTESLLNYWVVFPWEQQHPNKEQNVHENITRILQYIGEDVYREGLVGTPDRVVRMYSEIFRGYDPEQKPKTAIFKNGSDGIVYDQMIVDEGGFYSHCEHHMVPFFGRYFFAYIPDPLGNIIGLSKVARLVDYHAAKLQIQERLVHDIIEDIWQELSKDGIEPLGMGIVMVGEHLCKTMRGVKKKGQMTTIKLKGVIADKPDAKNEFLNRCKV